MSDPRHAFIDRWHRRNYRFDGTDVLSVTTINNNMRSYGLDKWKLKRAVDTTLRMATRSMREVHRMSEPDDKGQRHASGAVVQIMAELDKRSEASDKGVRVHEALEAWFTSGTTPDNVTDADAPYIEQAIRWAIEWNPRPLYQEPEVFADYGYAGSVDAIMEINGATVIVDYKTGGVFETAAMQLAAYSHADRLYPRLTEEPCAVLQGGACECAWVPMPVVDRLAVLALKPDSYELQWVTPIASGLAWNAFVGALAQNLLKKHRELFITARRIDSPVARTGVDPGGAGAKAGQPSAPPVKEAA